MDSAHDMTHLSVSPSGTELTEQQEIKEIKRLLKASARCERAADIAGARRLAYDAYGIDSTDVTVLEYLVNINIRSQRYEQAQYHAESLMELHPSLAVGNLLRGKVLLEIHHYRDCIDELLNCVLKDSSYSTDVVSLISLCAQGILGLTGDFMAGLTGMDSAETVAELGIALLSGAQYVTTIHILEASLQILAPQTDILMKIHLTLGHALCATKQHDSAFKHYGCCLEAARSSNDVGYETKSYVNMAALHISRGETYEALIVYEKLIDLQARMLNDGIECSDIWTDEFVYGLYMNISIAYKTVGDIDMAIVYARKYLDQNSTVASSKELSLLHKHIGQLYDIVGDHSQAVAYFKSHLGMARKTDNPCDAGEAFGLLAMAYGKSGFLSLSTVYHEKHISIVGKILANPPSSAVPLTSARRAMAAAYELFADSLLLQQLYEEANDNYSLMLQYSDSLLSQATALYKLGQCHLKRRNLQHALHYLEEASAACGDNFPQLSLDIKFCMACSAKGSSSSNDLEMSRKNFIHCLSQYKQKWEESLIHRKYLPPTLLMKLDLTYQGLQDVLSKLGCDIECLEVAEEGRSSRSCLPSHHNSATSATSVFMMADIIETVNSQGSPVLYYSFLDSSLLMWMIVPGSGLVRFYNRKPSTAAGSVEEELVALLQIVMDPFITRYKSSIYRHDTRHIERKSPRHALQTTQVTEKLLKSSHTASSFSSTDCYKQIYKLLLSPMDDFLSKLTPADHLIVVPHGAMSLVSFGRLRDLKGTVLNEKFTVTTLPSLHALRHTQSNCVRHLQQDDDVKFHRQEARFGGCYKYLTAPEVMYSTDADHQLPFPTDIDSKKVSNSRLLSVSKSSNDRTFSKETASGDAAKDDRSIHRLVQVIPKDKKIERSQGHAHNALNTLFCLPKPLLHGHGTDRITDVKDASVPPPGRHEPRSERGHAASVQQLLRTENLSTLITSTSTGTDSLTSTTAIPTFQQISSSDKFVVIGNPKLYSNMVLGASVIVVPDIELERSMAAEIDLVCEILGCHPITSDQATKDALLSTIEGATCLHIATLVNLKSGFLLMSCPNNMESIEERYYVVTTDDISKLNMAAKLVLISGGGSLSNLSCDQQDLQRLPMAFIAAGAEAIITLPLPLPRDAMQSFLYEFYCCLDGSQGVYTAVDQAIQKTTAGRDIDLFPVSLCGSDVIIDRVEIKSAMLHQQLDKIEEQQAMLNVPPKPKIPTLEHQLHGSLSNLKEICSNISGISVILRDLVKLLLQALSAMETETTTGVVKLPETLLNFPAVVKQLKLIGFTFEPRGLTQKIISPAVLFPCWDPEELILRTLRSSEALSELTEIKMDVIESLRDVLPLSQSLISDLVDTLLLTVHSPSIQLSVTDVALRHLWSQAFCKKLIEKLGFHQIGSHLHFSSTYLNRASVKSSLKFFLSVSLNRDYALLDRFNPSFNNKGPYVGSDTGDGSRDSLPTIFPVILPDRNLVRRVPWSARLESCDEMKKKVILAESCLDIDKKFRLQKAKMKRLQHSTSGHQAAEVLDDQFHSQPKSEKVKVTSGATASKQRLAVGYFKPLTQTQLEQRRKYSDYSRSRKESELELRRDAEVHSLFWKYADAV